MFDRIITATFILGLLVVAFLAGATVLHYRLPFSTAMLEAFEGGEAWVELISKHSSFENVSNDDEYDDDNSNFIFSTSKNSPFWNQASAHNGYTLFTLTKINKAYIIDMEGHFLHSWHTPFSKAWSNPTHIHKFAKAQINVEKALVFPDGNLLVSYAAIGDTPYGYGLAKWDKDSNVIWTYDANVHHDFYIEQQNGNIYALTQAFIKEPITRLEKLGYPLLNDYVAILSPQGKELDKISIIDAFKDSPFEILLFGKREKGEKIWDPLHTNSVMKLEPEIAAKFPMFKAGDILISLRHMGAIAVIDKDSRKIKWAHKGVWKTQHAASFLGNGNILLLDNDSYSENSKKYSRIIEVDPATMAVKWVFFGGQQFAFYTPTHGRVQGLPNSNKLVTESRKGRIFEVTNDGAIAWSYIFPESKNGSKQVRVITAYRYEISALPFLNKEN